MADDIDATDVKSQLLLDATIAQVSTAAANIKPGIAGDCEACGEPSLRLIKAYNPLEREQQLCCAPCRDKFLKAGYGRNL